MSLVQIILRRLPTPRNNILKRISLTKIAICQKSEKSHADTSSSSSSDSDEEIKKKGSSEDALKRLNTLLQQMVSDDATKGKESIKLAQPTNKRNKEDKGKDSVTTEPMEKQMVNAVRDVAESLGGNTKQTESELLLKLLNPVENQEESSSSLSEILKGMKIERETKPQQSKAEQVRSVLHRFSSASRTQQKPIDQKRPKRSQIPVIEQVQLQRVDLFGGEPLGIFTNPSNLKESPQLHTWQKLHQKELKLAVTHPPANYFQEMILWTEQGKVWQFPINNESGLEEESKVYFADHVFLEHHLEPWCPSKGPIRHFMELVCVGLSKNSYLTVEAKKEHIDWFKNYFEDKKKLLQEVGAIQADQPKRKSIDKE